MRALDPVFHNQNSLEITSSLQYSSNLSQLFTLPNHMIHVTDAAARHLQGLLTEKAASPAEMGLRLMVEKGGCAGLQYSMKLAAAEPTDEVTMHQGLQFMVDAASCELLDGCEIDYLDSLAESGFRIHNPRAVRSCGCGTSFEAASPEPSSPATS